MAFYAMLNRESRWLMKISSRQWFSLQVELCENLSKQQFSQFLFWSV